MAAPNEIAVCPHRLRYARPDAMYRLPRPGESSFECYACWQVQHAEFLAAAEAAGGVHPGLATVAAIAPAVPLPPDAPPFRPCRHKSEEPVPAAVAAAAGKNPLKLWHECGHPDKPLGDLTCSCAGCNATCPGYQPAPVQVDPETSDG